EDVAQDDAHARVVGVAPREPVGEPGIDLDQVEPPGACRELVCEGAEARADLERDRAWADVRRLDDPARDRRIAEEVLSPAPARREPGRGERFARLAPRAHRLTPPSARRTGRWR